MPSLQHLRLTWASASLLVLVSTIVASPIHAQRVPAPIILQVTGTAASATVTWEPVRGAMSYSVKRWKQDDLKCCNNSVEGLTRPAWTDEGSQREGFPQPGIYVFEVTAQLEGAAAAGVINWTLAPAPVVGVPVLLPPTIAAPAPSQAVLTQLERPTIRQPVIPVTPPTSISITGTPSSAKVHWESPTGDLSGLKSYSVERWRQDAPDCCRKGADGLLSHEWIDPGMSWLGVYVFRVSAVYADGRRAAAPEVSFNHTEPKNPTSISYHRASPASLELSWNSIGAAYYKLWGASNPDTGRYVGPCNHQPPAALQAAAAKFGQVIPPTCDVMVPAAKDSGNWMVGAFYQPGDVSSPSSSFTRLVLGLPAPNTAPTTAPAKYRVSVSSFQVNHETVDDPFSQDGRGDEVYLSVVVLEPAQLKPSATWTARSQLIESQVFGDRNNAPNRTQAGSRSADGGLQTGDVVTLADPLVVWDGLISTPVLVIPTIWEWDGPALLGIQSAWYARMRPGGGDMLNRWKSTYTSPASFEYPEVASRTLQYLVDAPCTGCFIGTADAQATGTFQNPMVGYNRPIAVNMYAGSPFGPAFAPGVISLSPTNLAAFLAGKSSAELSVNYKDQSEGMGDYTITLRFEKVP